MASQELDIDSIFKLKVDGLKEELKKRKLPIKGSKSELQERLLQYVTTSSVSNDTLSVTSEQLLLADTSEEEVAKKDLEESLQDLETPNLLDENPKFEDYSSVQTDADIIITEPVPNAEDKKEGKDLVPKKKTTISFQSTQERIENRTKRFGTVVSEGEKKKARLLKFSENIETKNIVSISSDDKMKKRIERFGKVSKLSSELSEKDKLELRKERFVDDRMKKRQERFGIIGINA